MKSVLLSIKPKYCELIAAGKKTIELRKTRPKIETPFKCFIYECLGKRLYNDYFDYEGCGKVIGEFVCDGIILMADSGVYFASITDYDVTSCCLNYRELHKYGNGKNLYGWHISDLVIYDKPKEVSEFYKHDNTYDNVFGWVFEDRPKKVPIKRPPQSWCYVEEV